MNKLTLSLGAADVKVLASVLGHILVGTDVKQLKQELRVDYLLFACVHKFFNKLDAKNKEIMSFGITPGKLVKISMERHEALAFFFLTEESDEVSYLPSIPDSTANLIREIRTGVHKQFLI